MYLSTYRYDSFNPRLHATICFGENKSTNKLFALNHASDSWQSKGTEKCYLFWFRSIFKLSILSHNLFAFLHQNLNRKHRTCRRLFLLKNIVFLPCITVVIVRKFQIKNILILYFLDFRKNISPKLQVLSLPAGSASKTFYLWKFFW